MAGFLYFVEGDKPLTSMKQVDDLGLSHAFDTLPQCTQLPRGTPSGNNGYLLTDSATLGNYQPRYLPEEQTWRQFGKVWVGYYTAATPTPDDLRRTQILPGVDVKLCDGNKWTVPFVYFYTADGLEANLPRYLDLDNAGRCIPGRVLEKYDSLAERCEHFFSEWAHSYEDALQRGDAQFVVTCDTVNEDAAHVLAANYRVSIWEIVVLPFPLFQIGQTAGEVLRVACDCDTAAMFLSYAYQQKKSEQDSGTSDIADGHAA